MTIKRLMMVTCVLLLSGCSPDNDAKSDNAKVLHTLYAVNTGGMEWSLTVFINGQPAIVEWTTSGLVDVSQFVTNGKNHVHMVAKTTHEDNVLWPCKQKFLKLTGSQTDGTAKLDVIALIEEPAPDRDQYEIEFDFEANMSVEWIWENGDPIGEFTNHDKAEIRRLVEGLAERYETESGVSIHSLTTRWTDATLETPCYPPIDTAGLEQVEREIKDCDDFVIELASWESVDFVVGTKIVALRPRVADSDVSERTLTDEFGSPLLIRAGSPPSDEWQPHIAVKTLFFVKREGSWRMLSQAWRF